MAFEVPADWPEEVRAKIETLTESIEFSSTATNGQNGYVAFGRNRIMGNEVAVKFYYWGGKTEFHLEPQALTSLDNSKYILDVSDAGFAGDEYAYYATPKCSGGDIEGVISKGFCGTRRAIDICSDVLHGLCYLHQRRLIHRDLKPANIYLNGTTAVIGDFGSVAALPEGATLVPASQHSLLYRPPESCASNQYGIAGDIYQAGVLLYQLLGGRLPYEEQAWLTESETQKAASLPPPDDRIFIDDCIKKKIQKGKLLDLSSLPPVVDERLKKIIRKATHVDPSKRYSSAAEFLAKLSEARQLVSDWRKQGAAFILKDKTSYRISGGGPYEVAKRRTADWRTDHNLSSFSKLADIVREIESRSQR